LTHEASRRVPGRRSIGMISGYLWPSNYQKLQTPSSQETLEEETDMKNTHFLERSTEVAETMVDKSNDNFCCVYRTNENNYVLQHLEWKFCDSPSVEICSKKGENEKMQFHLKSKIGRYITDEVMFEPGAGVEGLTLRKTLWAISSKEQ